MTDEQDWIESFIECGSETLAKIRGDWASEKALIRAENRQLTVDLDALLAPLRERLARIEGKMEVLLGGDTNPAKSKRSRQSPENGHTRLLEPPQAQ